MAATAGIILARPWLRPGRDLWLGLDLTGAGDRIHELADPESPDGDLAGAVIVAGEGTSCRSLPGRGVLVPAGVFWSLIDPLGASAAATGEATPDRLALEQELRADRRRFLGRLAWWRAEAAREVPALEGILKGVGLDLGPLWKALEQCPAGGREASPAGPAPAAPAAPGLALPSSDPDAVHAWLAAEEGLGALYGVGFAPRLEQADMGLQVARAFGDEHPLLIEAGTGVGKTLAYLIPLAARLKSASGRGVISTHTRALQTQILDQDLPRLAPLLGELTYARLMGRRNYLCLRQRMAYLTRAVVDERDALQVAAFRLWLRATRHGLREELVDHPLLGTELRALFDAADLCLPGLCYEGDRCFVQSARRRARSADLLVVNHALLLNDFRADHTLIGEYRFLVVDEAHRLPEVTLETHGIACGLWRLEQVENLLASWGAKGGLPGRLVLVNQRLEAMGPEGRKAAALAEVYGRAAQRSAAAYQAWWAAMDEALGPLLAGQGAFAVRLRIRDKAAAFAPTRALGSDLGESLAAATAACARFGAAVGALDDLPDALQDDLAQVAQSGLLLGQLHQDVHFLTEDPDDAWVTWAEPGARGRLRILGATLLEAGGVLRENWLGSQLQPVLTSATLAVGEDFTHMLQELGLTRRRPPARTYVCPSPFDYHEQALVLTPGRFLAPDSPGFGTAVGEVLAELALATGRKTMGLFTSYRQLREAAAAVSAAGIMPPGEGNPGGRPVLLQQTSGGHAGALLETFRRMKQAVLLGTSSFWEGVDFPGEDLEILVVAKLPFLVPNDPWVEARCERMAAMGDNPFTDFMVRDAVLRLKQGFGRLIRRPTDHGVVIILDNRLHTKNYGTTFLAGLPVMPRGFGDNQDLLAKVTAFFQQH
ncbi:MAG: helicase C-terminal domain-containing protein [bacterium]